VVARHVVEPDAVVVEVVEDGQAALVALPVVRLGSAGPASVGPVDIVVGPPARPADASTSHVAPRPKVLLTLPTHQSEKLSFLGAAVNGDWSHTILPAKAGSSAGCEGGAAETPGNQVVSSFEVMIWSISATTPSSAATATISTLGTTAPVSTTTKEVAKKSKLRFSNSQCDSGEQDECGLHPDFLQLLLESSGHEGAGVQREPALRRLRPRASS